MINLIKEYGNLDERDYKIVRNGAKGDTATTYTLFNRDKEAQELPERPEVSGENNFVLNKSLDVMEQIARGTYVPAQDTASSTRSATDLFLVGNTHLNSFHSIKGRAHSQLSSFLF
jgi:hypothetical protein